MFDITIVPNKVRDLAIKAGNLTMQIEKDLELGIVKDAASYIPEGEAAREALIAICETAIAGCKALAAIADSDGVKGRLKRLMDDITHLKTDKNHKFTHIVMWCEVVIHHLITNRE